MVSWEVLLSKGQEWDWYNDPFWRVQTLAVLFVVGLGALVFRELRIANPVVNFRPLAERNFAACCIIIFCAYGVLYGASTSSAGPAPVAVRLRRLRLGPGACRPRASSPSCMMLVVGTSIGRGVDARWLIAGGLLVMAAGCYWMALMNLESARRR